MGLFTLDIFAYPAGAISHFSREVAWRGFSEPFRKWICSTHIAGTSTPLLCSAFSSSSGRESVWRQRRGIILAWGSLGLGEISRQRGDNAEPSQELFRLGGRRRCVGEDWRGGDIGS